MPEAVSSVTGCKTKIQEDTIQMGVNWFDKNPGASCRRTNIAKARIEAVGVAFERGGHSRPSNPLMADSKLKESATQLCIH